jgi:hypothetical protein
MERHIKRYVLWVLCVDDEVHDILTKLHLPNVRLLQLSKLETKELIRLKPGRSKAEYCWTLTPFAPRFVFEADESVERVTYLDADLWFRKHPKLIFSEFDASGKHVLITDHAYEAEYDQSTIAGQYCVQFMIFKRHYGEIVREWWERRCIEWCYANCEDGKFGDQKYLDEWPEKFKNEVHILRDKELLLAPWNAMRYPYGNSVCWHFHGFRVVKSWKIIFFKKGQYEFPLTTIENIYIPYIKDIKSSLINLNNLNYDFKSQSNYSIFKILKFRISYFKRKYTAFRNFLYVQKK